MNLAVEIPTKNPTCGHNKHCDERHIAVDRAKLEICVPQNHYRSENAKDHVSAEPEADGADYSQGSHAFSQGIQQQKQHKDASSNSQPIPKPALRGQARVVAIAPPDPQDDDSSDAEG